MYLNQMTRNDVLWKYLTTLGRTIYTSDVSFHIFQYNKL